MRLQTERQFRSKRRQNYGFLKKQIKKEKHIRKLSFNMIDSTSSSVNVAKESREICARNQSGDLQANL